MEPMAVVWIRLGSLESLGIGYCCVLVLRKHVWPWFNVLSPWVFLCDNEKHIVGDSVIAFSFYPDKKIKREEEEEEERLKK